MAWIVAVYNIPDKFDSFSLREFFDLKDSLDLFHFKNRPESSLRQIVQKYFPNVHLEGGVAPPETERVAKSQTSSTITVDFKSMILGKRKESSSPSCNASTSPVLVAPPNMKSAFIKVKREKLAAFRERYHGRLWQSRTPPAADGQSCLITPLAREDDPSSSIPACEEFHPPTALCRGNVGTSNSELVRLIGAGGLLSDAMLAKTQRRAPALWRWARQPPLPCSHSAAGGEACHHIFAYNIPHSYLKKDLKFFLRESIEAKSVCQLTYIGRPTSIFLQFLQESLPHYLAPSPPGLPFEEGVPCPTLDDRVSDHLDLYPFSALSDGPKSCLLRVRCEHSQEFLSRYSGRAWGGDSTGSCSMVKIKQYDTGRLAFLSEYRHVRSSSFGAPYSREGSFLGLFLARLVPDALRERLRVAQPELACKLQELEQRAPSVTSLPNASHDDPKHTLHPHRRRLLQYAAIPPPRTLEHPRRRRHPQHNERISPNCTSDEKNLEDDDSREHLPNASHASKDQNVTEGLSGRNAVIQPPFSCPIVQGKDVSVIPETDYVEEPNFNEENFLNTAGSGFRRQNIKKKIGRRKNKESNPMREANVYAETMDPLEQVLLGDARNKDCRVDGSYANCNHAADGERKNTEKERAWAKLKRDRYTAKPSKKRKKARAKEVLMESEGSEDGSDVEEWERSEAFRDTIDEKHSARERLYEEEIELVWEKGGSGLNFYTDEVYWRAQQGGFDERSTDEWDVDMQGYYGGVPGDYDAECRQDMERMDRLRAGGDESCFVAPRAAESRSQRRKRARAKPATEAFITPCREGPDAVRRRMLVNLRTDDEPEPPTKTARRKANKARRDPPPKVGLFEQHTRGIGRRLLEEKGWRDGQGLGRHKAGRPHAVPADGQRPWDKKGLGFEEATPGWLPPKPSSPPPGSPCTPSTPDDDEQEKHQAKDESNPSGLYKDVPIPKLLQHSVMMTKLFEKDFNALLKGEDPDYGEDIVLAIRKMDTKRKKVLKTRISTLKEEVTEEQANRVRLLKEYFVKADIESSDGDEQCDSQEAVVGKLGLGR